MKKWWGRVALCGSLAQAALAGPSVTGVSMSYRSAAEPRPASVSRDTSGNELSYGAYIDSRSRFKCLYGYVADKTGDHGAAIEIFEDCIARWEDVYSMIWLAMMHENGTGVPRDLTKATELMHRGALSPENAGYATLARYHYGVALHQGRGVPRDAQAARHWLERAAAEGEINAASYLALHFPPPPVP